MRIGILGGTFDPVHNGHIYLAEKVSRKLGLSKIIFIPAYLPPHKKGLKVTSAGRRYAMLKIALRGRKRFSISDVEIKRKGRSYSVETLRYFRKRYGPKADIFFITGSDSLRELGRWKNLKEILGLCKFVIVKRPGFGIKKAPEGFILLDINAKDISARDIRKRLGSGKPISSLVPGRIKQYIYRYKLYRAGVL